MKFRTSIFAVLLLGVVYYGYSAFSVSKTPVKASGGTPQENQILSTPTVAFTPTIAPTPTPNFEVAVLQTQAADLQAQVVDLQNQLDVAVQQVNESNAANREVILAQLAEQEKQRLFEEEKFRVGVTQAAMPTVIAMQEKQLQAEAKQREFDTAYPALLRERAESEAYAARAADYAAAEIWLMWLASAFFAVAIIAIISASISAARKREIVSQLEVEYKPIPPAPKKEAVFEKVSETVQKKVYTDIPCSHSELHILADGIMRGMTLAVNQWEGTPVHKRLISKEYNLRNWAIGSGFFKPIPGKGNELIITDKGTDFFEDTVNLKEPPAPFVCIYQDEDGQPDESQQ